MRVRIKLDKSIHESAAAYYNEAKEARQKAERIRKAIEETSKEIAKAEKDEAEHKQKNIKIVRKKAWYEKFHYFFTSGGKLVIGGRNAEQNDFIFKNYLKEEDLFFHADIQGGSACIMKGGVGANEKELLEAAQFAASFSNAWKNKNAAVDVYCVSASQVSKHATGGYIAKGAFAIVGERKWFRNVELKLKIGIENGIPTVLPFLCTRKMDKEIILVPGTHEKGEIVKRISKRLEMHPDEVQNLLPPGKINIITAKT